MYIFQTIPGTIKGKGIDIKAREIARTSRQAEEVPPLIGKTEAGDRLRHQGTLLMNTGSIFQIFSQSGGLIHLMNDRRFNPMNPDVYYDWRSGDRNDAGASSSNSRSRYSRDNRR